jgi:hypothetical protein
MTSVEPRPCADCGTLYAPKRDTGSLYCSMACNSRAYRVRRKGQRPTFGVCEVEDCGKRRKTKGARWCEAHYLRWSRYGDPTADGRRPPKADGICLHCEGPSERGRMYCSTLCRSRHRSGVANQERDCVVCGDRLPIKDRPDRLYCGPDCRSLGNRARSYGLDAADYLRLHRDQGGRCAICGTMPEKLFIDHDHASGYVRGLLCTQCNVGIGMFKEDRERLRAAIEYIGRPSDDVEQRSCTSAQG